MMIRATELGGRAVVDLDAAEKIGKIHKVILDPDSRRVAGFVVSSGESLFRDGSQVTLPAAAVHAIGPDAVTVRQDARTADDVRLDTLPRVSDLVGRKVVSRDGKLLGTVDDVLIDGNDGRIVGYQLAAPNVMARLEGMMSPDKQRRAPYLRADADLRAGHDLIVAPEDAVSEDWSSDGAAAPISSAAARATTSRWADRAPSSTSRSEWRRPDAADRARETYSSGK